MLASVKGREKCAKEADFGVPPEWIFRCDLPAGHSGPHEETVRWVTQDRLLEER